MNVVDEKEREIFFHYFSIGHHIFVAEIETKFIKIFFNITNFYSLHFFTLRCSLVVHIFVNDLLYFSLLA
jgi:hypothetical protein